MKIYHLTILGYSEKFWTEVHADYFTTQTNSSTSSGYYAFYTGDGLVACYPIDKTIITSIEPK
jgi:hypothetical protein